MSDGPEKLKKVSKGEINTWYYFGWASRARKWVSGEKRHLVLCLMGLKSLERGNMTRIMLGVMSDGLGALKKGNITRMILGIMSMGLKS